MKYLKNLFVADYNLNNLQYSFAQVNLSEKLENNLENLLSPSYFATKKIKFKRRHSRHKKNKNTLCIDNTHILRDDPEDSRPLTHRLAYIKGVSLTVARKLIKDYNRK